MRRAAIARRNIPGHNNGRLTINNTQTGHREDGYMPVCHSRGSIYVFMLFMVDIA
jgi:hypothetical protein